MLLIVLGEFVNEFIRRVNTLFEMKVKWRPPIVIWVVRNGSTSNRSRCVKYLCRRPSVKSVLTTKFFLLTRWCLVFTTRVNPIYETCLQKVLNKFQITWCSVNSIEITLPYCYDWNWGCPLWRNYGLNLCLL